VLEELLPAEVLIIGVLHPALAQRLIRQVVGVFEDDQSCHQPRGQRRLTGAVRIGLPKRLLPKRPIRLARQLHQRMSQVDDLVQSRSEQVLLARLATLVWLHSLPRIDSRPIQGITNPICKESLSRAPVSGKIDYFPAAVSDSKSTGSEFFTDDLLEAAIQNALDDGGFVELEQVRHLPGMTRAVLRTLRKIWAADFDLAAAGGAGHRRIAEMSLIEARLRSTLASGCDDAARPARRRLETSCGVHHRGDRSRTPMDSSTRPSMLSSPPPIPSDSDVDRRRASCSHSRNIASFSSRDS
jgi:hypothetical protein